MSLQMRCEHFHTEFVVRQSKDVETVLEQKDVPCPPICKLYWIQESAGRDIRGETIFKIFASPSTSIH